MAPEAEIEVVPRHWVTTESRDSARWSARFLSSSWNSSQTFGVPCAQGLLPMSRMLVLFIFLVWSSGDTVHTLCTFLQIRGTHNELRLEWFYTIFWQAALWHFLPIRRWTSWIHPDVPDVRWLSLHGHLALAEREDNGMAADLRIWIQQLMISDLLLLQSLTSASSAKCWQGGKVSSHDPSKRTGILIWYHLIIFKKRRGVMFPKLQDGALERLYVLSLWMFGCQVGCILSPWPLDKTGIMNHDQRSKNLGHFLHMFIKEIWIFPWMFSQIFPWFSSQWFSQTGSFPWQQTASILVAWESGSTPHHLGKGPRLKLGQRHFNGTFNDHLGGYRGNGGMDLGITWDRITYFFRQSYFGDLGDTWRCLKVLLVTSNHCRMWETALKQQVALSIPGSPNMRCWSWRFLERFWSGSETELWPQKFLQISTDFIHRFICARQLPHLYQLAWRNARVPSCQHEVFLFDMKSNGRMWVARPWSICSAAGNEEGPSLFALWVMQKWQSRHPLPEVPFRQFFCWLHTCARRRRYKSCGQSSRTSTSSTGAPYHYLTSEKCCSNLEWHLCRQVLGKFWFLFSAFAAILSFVLYSLCHVVPCCALHSNVGGGANNPCFGPGRFWLSHLGFLVSEHGVASCKDKSGAVTWTEFLAAALCVSVCRNRRRVRVRVGRVSLKMLAGDLNNLDCDAIILGLRTIWLSSTLSLPKHLCCIFSTCYRRLVEAAFSVFDKDGDGKVSAFAFQIRAGWPLHCSRWAWKIFPTTSHLEMKERFSSGWVKIGSKLDVWCEE